MLYANFTHKIKPQIPPEKVPTFLVVTFTVQE
jgi:hypothetical protein